MKIGYVRTSTAEQNTARQEGIAIAKANGVYKGRKPIQRPEFPQVAALWREGRITAVEAMRRLDMRPRTFYRKVKEIGSQQNRMG